MADEEEQVRQAFNVLRPLCVQLTKEQTRDNADILRAALKHIDNQVFTHLLEYVVFPLQLILKQPVNKRNDLYLSICQCLYSVLSRAPVTHWGMFYDLFNCLCITISPPRPDAHKVSDIAEELKLESVKCLHVLIKKAPDSVLEKLYSGTCLPALGHAVSLLLSTTELEQLRGLRLEAMKCLLELSQADRKAGVTYMMTVGGIFASFLPGISMTLCKVISGDVKQGHAVPVLAIEVWSKVTCLVLGDNYLTSAQESARTKSTKVKGDEKYQQLIVTRDEKWVASTTEKLQVIVKRVVGVVTHPNWKVRLSLVDAAALLLNKCSRSLANCVPEFLEVLVGLVGDEYGNVASRSQRALTAFREEQVAEDAKPLVVILEENLHQLATQLPRLMRTADDEKKMATLNLFVGYVKLLGPQINSLLRSSSHLHRLTLALMNVLELDCSHVKVIAEKTPGGSISEVRNLMKMERPRKYFRHFNSDKVHHLLIEVCRYLGFYGDLDLLMDHCLELFHQGSLQRKQSILCINEILLGHIGEGIQLAEGASFKRDREHLECVIRMLLDEYMLPVNFDLITSNQPEEVFLGERVPSFHGDSISQSRNMIVSTDQESLHTVEQLNSNIVQVCLLLEGVGNCAKVQGVDFQYFLMDILYPLLEKLGSDTAMVHQTAYITLNEICTACGFSDIEDLIKSNSDYLVNSLSSRLRQLTSHPTAPLVLGVMLSYSSSDLLPLIQDVIDEIVSSLDSHYDEQAVYFMRVLYALVAAILRWYPPQCSQTSHENDNISVVSEMYARMKPEKEETEKDSTGPRSQSVADFFREYHRQKQYAAGSVEEEQETAEGIMGDAEKMVQDEEDDEKKEPPKHVQMVVQVLDRCVHLQSAPDPRLRLLVLRTIAVACQALHGHQDELLPEAHKVWAPLVPRLTDAEQLVIIQAYKTLDIMTGCCGSFLRQRLVKEVIPKFTSLLHKHASVSLKAGPAYKFTVGFKLQMAMLGCIGKICRSADIREMQLSLVMRACLPYLSARQPPQLQQACVETFRIFQVLEPDCVWLMLRDLYCPVPLTPPHPDLKAVKMAGSQERNEYSDNIQLILENE